MKVIISSRSVYPFHGFFGMEKYYYNLSRNLKNLGVNVKILTSYNGSNKKHAKYGGIDYTFLPPNLNGKRLMSIRYLSLNCNFAYYLKKMEFDILHGGYTTYPYLSFKKRKPVITELLGIEMLNNRGFSSMLNYMLSYNRVKMCVKKADAVACLTDFHTKKVTEFFGIDKNKIFILPMGIDIPAINKYLNESKISRKDLGINKDDFVMVTANRLDETKGITNLIDSFNIVRDKIKNSKLILIGSGPDETMISKQIEKYNLKDSILHLKNVPEENLYNYYNLSDLYVSPTFQDDFIMGILESMVCGLPIVSTSKNVVVESKVNGYIVRKGNPETLASSVIKIHDKNLKEKMGKMSKKIVKNYDFELIVKKLIRQYELISQKYDKM